MAGKEENGSLEDKIRDLTNSTKQYSREEIFKMLASVTGQGFNDLYTELMKASERGQGQTEVLDEMPEFPSEGISKLLEQSVNEYDPIHFEETIVRDQVNEYLQLYHNETLISLKVISENKEGGMGDVWFVKYDLDHSLKNIQDIFDKELEELKELDIPDKDDRILALKQAKFVADERAKKAAIDFSDETYVFKTIKETLLQQLNPKLRAEFIERFETEAKIPDNYSDLVAEDKGGIVPIPFKGVLKDGRPYMGMPVLDTTKKIKETGMPVKELSPETKHYTLEESLDKVYKIGFEVSRIHKEKLVHRDLKWDNIFWNGDYPVIGDFGLVKEMAEQDKTMMTQTGRIMGTPKYMSPEQANATLIDITKQLEGLQAEKDEKIGIRETVKTARKTIRLAPKNMRDTIRKNFTEQYKKKRAEVSTEVEDEIQEIDGKMDDLHNLACKSDQYTLGVMAYEIFTKIPAQFMYLANDAEFSTDKIRLAIQSDKLDVRVFPHEVMEGDSEMIRNISAVVLKATEKKQEDRYNTTEDFVNDLNACVEGITPEVLVKDSTYLETRHMRRSGADKFLEEGKYALGREILDDLLGKAVDAHEGNVKDQVLLEKRRTLEKALVDYKKGVKESLRKLDSNEVEEASQEIKNYVGNLSNKEFVEFVPELLNLIYKNKIGPVEEGIDKDKIPVETYKEGDKKGKWILSQGKEPTDGYWIDNLRKGGFDLTERIKELKKVEKKLKGFFGSEAILRRDLTFGKEYEENGDLESKNIFLQRAKGLIKLFNDNPARFIPQPPEDGAEEKYVLGVESLEVIDSLFNANKYILNNTYKKLALKQVDAVIKHLTKEDQDGISVYRFAVFDKNGKLESKEVTWFNEEISDKEKITFLNMQSYLIKGLVDAYKYTKDEKYKNIADKAIKYFKKHIPKNKITPLLANKEYQESTFAAAIALPSLIDYAKLTNDNKLEDESIELLKLVVKEKLDLTQDYQGIFKGPQMGKGTDNLSYTAVDNSLLTALSKLENNDLYKSRKFNSTKLTKTEGKVDWSKADYQCGFTDLENSVADEQTKIGIMNDDKALYVSLESNGDFENDYYVISLNGEEIETKLGKAETKLKIPYSRMGLENKPDNLEMNIFRIRGGKEEGKRKTISSWSPNMEDIYYEEYGPRRENVEMSTRYGTLNIK